MRRFAILLLALVPVPAIIEGVVSHRVPAERPALVEPDRGAARIAASAPRERANMQAPADAARGTAEDRDRSGQGRRKVR